MPLTLKILFSPAVRPKSAAPNTRSTSIPARKPSDLSDLPIKTVDGAVIHLSDVAQVRDGYQPQQNVVRNEGIRGALLTVYKTGVASTLDVVDGIKKALPKVLSGLPPE